MRLLEPIAEAFFRSFGITQPTPQARRRAAWFLLILLLLVLIALVSLGILLARFI
jgi:quinol-cytochrome oxidoreductase complex cytochrome b subunit